ncbi:LysR family transcriptional regulator [Gallaecimonas xiamenensis]|uniref:LysR family transcriptional regulator n=1 Tax=Gallaecimonas xiamenensis 3-C-1 TaxID=745411 RepID=K2K1S9_9GAMM|nr:LysR family transcriptional regulator [Gallaecimonas xiamenensis]EKE76784.1 LysR family transcriptional regulator [Gallaecimonas xiamenensis 3-C-1]
MDSLSGLLAFVRAAEARSYVAAGERLGLSPSAVGKSVARLEDKLGVRLLNRSTRRISLTEEGALFFERCQRIVGEIEEAEAELSRLTDAPRGRLRVSLPAVGYRMLMPILPEFTRRYPNIELDLDFNDRMIDVVAEGVDAVIRSGDFGNSLLKARKLGSFRFVLVGAPAYFAAHGAPSSPEDLRWHDCLRYRFPSTGLLQDWKMRSREPDPPMQLSGTLTFNNVEALISAAVGGMGIAYLPDFAVREQITAGTLTSVLDDYLTEGGRFAILWPSSRHLLPKLRVFVDFLAERLVLGP